MNFAELTLDNYADWMDAVGRAFDSFQNGIAVLVELRDHPSRRASLEQLCDVASIEGIFGTVGNAVKKFFQWLWTILKGIIHLIIGTYRPFIQVFMSIKSIINAIIAKFKKLKEKFPEGANTDYTTVRYAAKDTTVDESMMQHPKIESVMNLQFSYQFVRDAIGKTEEELERRVGHDTVEMFKQDSTTFLTKSIGGYYHYLPYHFAEKEWNEISGNVAYHSRKVNKLIPAVEQGAKLVEKLGKLPPEQLTEETIRKSKICEILST